MKILLLALLCVPLAHSSTVNPVKNDGISPWISGLANFANELIESPANNADDASAPSSWLSSLSNFANDMAASQGNNDNANVTPSSWLNGIANFANEMVASPVNNANDAISTSPWLSGLSNLANEVTANSINNAITPLLSDVFNEIAASVVKEATSPSPWLSGVLNSANAILEAIQRPIVDELLNRGEKDSANMVKPAINNVTKRKPSLVPYPKRGNKRPYGSEVSNVEDYCWDTTVDVDDNREDGVDIVIKRPGGKVKVYHHNILIYPNLTEVYCNDERGVKVTFYLMNMKKQLFWYRP